jgi:hypothetical protein
VIRPAPACASAVAHIASMLSRACSPSAQADTAESEVRAETKIVVAGFGLLVITHARCF